VRDWGVVGHPPKKKASSLTQLLSAGVHVKAVSERLGHSSTSFTMDTYSAVIPSMGRTAADAADQLFG
jgi:integrase